MLNLELLAYNFHESLDLEPLFIHLNKQISVNATDAADAREYRERLEKVAREITRKQLLVLEEVGDSYREPVDFESLLKNPGSIQLPQHTLTLGGIKRDFRVSVLEADLKMKAIKVLLFVSEPGEFPVTAEFWLGFFDFPMIDNTRLTHDQRCTVVLNAFGELSADISVVYFPGSYASLKEKPYYDEVLQKLRESESVMK